MHLIFRNFARNNKYLYEDTTQEYILWYLPYGNTVFLHIK